MQFDRASEDEQEYAVVKPVKQAEKLLDKRRDQMG